MAKIALVGNIASGKSTVENILREKGYKVYDTDEIAHEILDENKELFPYALEEGKINRKKLAQVVFNDKKQLEYLESVIHPKVRDFISALNSAENIFISVPQLFEAGFEDLFEKIIFISSPVEIRLERLMNRNNLTKEEAMLRINAQISEESKILKSDYVLFNDGALESLVKQLEEIIYLFDYKSQ